MLGPMGGNWILEFTWNHHLVMELDRALGQFAVGAPASVVALPDVLAFWTSAYAAPENFEELQHRVVDDCVSMHGGEMAHESRLSA